MLNPAAKQKDTWEAVCRELAASHGVTRDGRKRWNVGGGGLTKLVFRARAIIKAERAKERRQAKAVQDA